MAWSEEMVQAVWEKGSPVGTNDKGRWRQDECDAWIGRDEYGDRQSEYGWEIDHISPGGSDSLSNLRPLQWQNNIRKSDGRLKCAVVASGENNIANR